MPDDWFEKLARLTQSAGARLVVRSALNPLLWLCAAFCPMCWAAAYLFRTDEFVVRFAMVLSAVPVVTTCALAVYFAVRRPERLQSEQFQLRQQTLQLLQEKGSRVPLTEPLLTKVMNPTDPSRADQERL